VRRGRGLLRGLLRGESENLIEAESGAILSFPPLGLTPAARAELDGVLGLKMDLDLYAVLAATVWTVHLSLPIQPHELFCNSAACAPLLP
jgi:hypothetical protein